MGARLTQAGGDGGCLLAGHHPAVVEVGLQGGRRQGVDRVRADELLHVEHVRVVGVLGAGAGPQRALHARALGGQRFPARPAKDLMEASVGDLGVSDGDLSLELGLPDLVQRSIHRRVHAADEKRGHRGDAAEVTPGGP